jgi:hypothetical protein
MVSADDDNKMAAVWVEEIEDDWAPPDGFRASIRSLRTSVEL